MKQEPLLRLFTHSLDVAQHRMDLRLAAQVAVEGDAEAVRFVADLHQDLERM